MHTSVMTMAHGGQRQHEAHQRAHHGDGAHVGQRPLDVVHARRGVRRPPRAERHEQVRDGAQRQQHPGQGGAQLGPAHAPPLQGADGVHGAGVAVEADEREEEDAAVDVDGEEDLLELAEDPNVLEVGPADAEVDGEGQGEDPGRVAQRQVQ